MAPSVIAHCPVVDEADKKKTATTLPKARFTPGYSFVEPEPEVYEFEHLKPSFPAVSWPALEPFPYEDKGLQGDPEYRNLFEHAADVIDFHPKIGTEVVGVSLKTLTDAQKADLARLIAFRGVVVFRDQEDFTLDDQLELGRFFGPLHKHATTAVPKAEGYDEVHVIYTDSKTKDQRALFTPTYLWHCDVPYEIQPPSYTSLQVLHGPPRGAGGDTLWSSNYAAYDRLSAPMQKYLEGLTALHSAHEQADGSRAAGRSIRREPITSEHPLVRTNPVTGWKSLYYNTGFVKAIKGIPKLESDYIKKYLDEVMVTTQEVQCRYQLTKGSVVFWDNRTMNHSASFGFAPHRRHGVRVTPHGELPYFDPASRSQEEDLLTAAGLPFVNKDGSGTSNYND